MLVLLVRLRGGRIVGSEKPLPGVLEWDLTIEEPTETVRNDTDSVRHVEPEDCGKSVRACGAQQTVDRAEPERQRHQAVDPQPPETQIEINCLADIPVRRNEPDRGSLGSAVDERRDEGALARIFGPDLLRSACGVLARRRRGAAGRAAGSGLHLNERWFDLF